MDKINDLEFGGISIKYADLERDLHLILISTPLPWIS